jgi:hypothetical protein
MQRSPRVRYCTWMAARTRVNGDRRKEKKGTTTYQEINAAGRSTEDRQQSTVYRQDPYSGDNKHEGSKLRSDKDS